MNTQTLEVEIVQPVDDKLVKYAGETGLEKQSTETLVEAFRPIFAKSRAALADARGVAESVKDATCVREIMRSRACRLALRKIRLESDETREKHKKHALLFGKAVQGFHNILMADLVPVEDALQAAEDFAERAEAARLEALRVARVAELMPLLDEPLLGNLADLSESEYQKKLSNAQLLRRVKLADAAKVEADRLAQEEAARAERERLAAENSRLQAEAIAREATAKAEREAAEKKLAEEQAVAQAAVKEREVAEKKLADERSEAARLTAEIKAKADAEAKAAADAAAKKLATLERQRKLEQAEAEAVAKVAREVAAEAHRKELAKQEARVKTELDAMAAKAEAAREESDRLSEIERRDSAAAKAEAARIKADFASIKAEMEAKAAERMDAERRVVEDRLAAAAAAKKAAAAPDKAKLLAFADVIAELEAPSFSDEQLADVVRAKVRALASWCAEQAERL